jgi:NET1-associated nuclear protein 1 (U3 small nucleolar RNA-associated protein 17)
LELEGHEGDVTAVVVVALPATAAARLVSNCWTAGLDGVLIYWDFMAAEALRKVHVGLPVHSMVSSSCFFFSISLFDGMC